MSPGAVSPGAGPPGAGPPEVGPPGAVSPGTVSPGEVSPGVGPPGVGPPGTVPEGVRPPGTVSFEAVERSPDQRSSSPWSSATRGPARRRETAPDLSHASIRPLHPLVDPGPGSASAARSGAAAGSPSSPRTASGARCELPKGISLTARSPIPIGQNSPCLVLGAVRGPVGDARGGLPAGRIPMRLLRRAGWFLGERYQMIRVPLVPGHTGRRGPPHSGGHGCSPGRRVVAVREPGLSS